VDPDIPIVVDAVADVAVTVDVDVVVAVTVDVDVVVVVTVAVVVDVAVMVVVDVGVDAVVMVLDMDMVIRTKNQGFDVLRFSFSPKRRSRLLTFPQFFIL